MELVMHIKNIKMIKDLEFRFPLEIGLYAITGENGSGKSTLVSCASTVFFIMPMIDYFGRPDDGASIDFKLNDGTRQWVYDNGKWNRYSNGKMKVNGFYEGSIIFGNRFKNAQASIISVLDKIEFEELLDADEFVRSNLGEILHNDGAYYQNLYCLKRSSENSRRFKTPPYFFKYNNKIISQPRMSTGENLLISILHSINLVRKKRTTHNDGRPCIVFLDEIELALHASALRRLVFFLNQMSKDLNLAIFFSTHSIELIRHIKPQNIYYIDRIQDKIFVTNPCYPAFATRNLYADDGYGNDLVILVEDDVAQAIVERLIYEKRIIENARFKVLPTGGWTNTIRMAYDVITSHLLNDGTKLAVVLDKDIQKEVPQFISKNKQYSGIPIDYLPISSLEKFLKKNLIDNIDEKLYKSLNTYLFQRKPLSAIIAEYRALRCEDNDGKTFYGKLINELKGMRKDREALAESVINYLIENDQDLVQELMIFIKDKM